MKIVKYKGAIATPLSMEEMEFFPEGALVVSEEGEMSEASESA